MCVYFPNCSLGFFACVFASERVEFIQIFEVIVGI